MFSQTNEFEMGISYYNNRAEGASGLIPSDSNIIKAIKIFESLQEPYNTSEQDLNASIYLTKSYYFMAQYVAQEKDDKKLYFDLAKDLSERYIYKWSSKKYKNDKEFWKWTIEKRGYADFKQIVDEILNLDQQRYEEIIKDKINYICYSKENYSGYKYIRNFLYKLLK